MALARKGYQLLALLAAPTLTVGSPARAQLTDAFAAHFGVSRTREPLRLVSVSAGILLLTQFGSRWSSPTSTQYAEYDQVGTTVGYNYLQGGYQHNWPFGGLLGGTPVLAAGATLGFTSDRLTRAGQDGLHDFRRFPHVRREVVSNGVALIGLEAEGSHWWGWHFWGMDVEMYPTVGVTFASHHRELSASFGTGVDVWKVRLQAAGSHGWLFARASVKPAQVGSRLADSYTRFEASVAFDRNRFGSMARYIPSGGVAVARSTGHVSGEEERLLSVFFDFPSAFPNHSVRLEAVNDLLGEKDRGPTGGLRITYVARL